jgi:RNA polymerase sigma-70 factor (ECF subfamily)
MELGKESIIRRCQQGDRQAWGELYASSRSRLMAVCRHYVGSADVAEDLLHDAYILIFNHLSELKDDAKADAWMTAVMRNVAIYYLNHQTGRQQRPIDEATDVIGTAPEPCDDEYQRILQAVDMLPSGYRQVFRLSVLEGLTHEEIADLLHIEPHTSSSQLFRAKKILQRSLGAMLLGLLAILIPVGIKHLYDKPTSIPSASEGSPMTATIPTPAETDTVRQPAGFVLKNNEQIINKKEQRANHKEQVTIVNEQIANNNEQTANDNEQITKKNEQIVDNKVQIASENEQIKDNIVPVDKSGTTSGFNISLAYSGLGNRSRFDLPYADGDINDEPIDSATHHSLPITVGVLVSKNLNSHWSVGTGLQYTWLSSETELGNSRWQINRRQRLGYLGVPLRMEWHPVNSRLWRLSAAGSVLFELPVHYRSTSTTYNMGQQIEQRQLPRPSLHPQWSIGTGVGVEYRLTPVIGFFAEPTLQYYFGTGDDVSTWRSEHPLTFSLPIGLRVNF